MDENTTSPNHHSPQPPDSGGILEFITFTNPEMAKTNSNKRLIRSQAMRDVHRRSGSRKQRKNEIELDISSLLSTPAQNIRAYSAAEKAENSNPNSASRLVFSLSVSRLDPFFPYPIQMGNHEHELYDHRELTILTHRTSLIVYQCTMKLVLCFGPCEMLVSLIAFAKQLHFVNYLQCHPGI
jgi:hypothetical protein